MDTLDDVDKLLKEVDELNVAEANQRLCMSQLSLAVRLCSVPSGDSFSGAVSLVEHNRFTLASCTLQNRTGVKLLPQFWQVHFEHGRAEYGGRTTHGCWRLHEPWSHQQSVTFQLPVASVERADVSLTCALVFYVDSSYTGRGGGGAREDGSGAQDSDGGAREAILSVHVYSTVLDALHLIESASAVTRTRYTDTSAGGAGVLISHVPAVRLAVSARSSASCADLHQLWSQLLQNAPVAAKPSEDASRLRHVTLWGAPLTLTLSQRSGLITAAVEGRHPQAVLRVWTALQRRLPQLNGYVEAHDDELAQRVSCVLGARTQSLQERLRQLQHVDADDAGQLLEMWSALQTSVMERLPAVTPAASSL